MDKQIWHRLQLLVAQGVGVLVGSKKIQVKILDDEVLTNIDRVEPYGFSYRPHPNCQAYIMFPSGDRSRGVALVVGDKQYQLELQNGEVAVHDDQGQKIHLTRAGIVVDGGGKPITLTNAPKVRVEADLEVTGQIKDLCDAAGRSMSGMRQIYNSHTHSDPQGGNVAAPNQGM